MSDTTTTTISELSEIEKVTLATIKKWVDGGRRKDLSKEERRRIMSGLGHNTVALSEAIRLLDGRDDMTPDKNSKWLREQLRKSLRLQGRGVNIHVGVDEPLRQDLKAVLDAQDVSVKSFMLGALGEAIKAVKPGDLNGDEKAVKALARLKKRVKAGL